jgi:hypothetical protein
MIYIQSNSERTLPHHFDAACAFYGAIDSGLEVRLTTIEEIQSGKFDLLLRKNTAIGSADFMVEVFSRLGKKPELPLFSDRHYTIENLGSVRERILNGEKLFIKPSRHKLFSGFVATNANISTIANLEEETEVIVYEPFTSSIKSEWRIYISNGKMVDSRNYSGDFTISPDYILVKQKVETLKNFPCAFVIDVGILPDKSNVTIEFNDMWAIGNYGIENSLYLELLINRYTEIISK